MTLLRQAWASFLRMWRAPLFSPLGFLDRGLVLLALFAVAHLLGWRDNTCFISGTSPTGDPLEITANLYGVTYFITYTLALLIAPIFLIGAGLFALIRVPSLPQAPSEVTSPGK
jgi:hypothetical protein